MAIEPATFLSPDTTLVSEEVDAPALLAANVQKMHHQQATSQWIRTWSFGLAGFFIGYSSLVRENLTLLVAGFLLMEALLLIVLLKDVEWNRPFWRYQHRARCCEGFLLGTLTKEQFRRAYLSAEEPSRLNLIRGAFSIRQMLTVSTDFIESYLMMGVAFAFIIMAYWILHQ